MEITDRFYTYKSLKEVKLENDEGMGPSKEFPWSLLQKQFEEADYNYVEVLYKVEYHGKYERFTSLKRCTFTLSL